MKEIIKKAIKYSIDIVDEFGNPVFYNEPHFQYVLSCFLAQKFGFYNVIPEYVYRNGKESVSVDIRIMKNEKDYPIELKYSYNDKFGTTFGNIFKIDEIINTLRNDGQCQCKLANDIDKIRDLLEKHIDKIDKGYCIFLADKEREKNFNDLCE